MCVFLFVWRALQVLDKNVEYWVVDKNQILFKCDRIVFGDMYHR